LVKTGDKVKDNVGLKAIMVLKACIKVT